MEREFAVYAGNGHLEHEGRRLCVAPAGRGGLFRFLRLPALVAVVTVIVGATTSALAPGHAMAIAVVTLATAVAPPAAVELLRLARGQSDLSDLLGGESL